MPILQDHRSNHGHAGLVRRADSADRRPAQRHRGHRGRAGTVRERLHDLLRGGVARDARIEGVLHLGQLGRAGADRAAGEIVGGLAVHRLVPALPARGVEAFRHRLALGISAS